MNKLFVGRQSELETLSSLSKKKVASLVVIYGRRRVGKSRLIKEFGKHCRFYSFSGLPETKQTTAQSQREEFARQMREQLNLPGLKAEDWGDLFTLLASHTQEGSLIIALDEISWMGSKDPDFLGKLKTAWDNAFSENPQLILIICGSVSAWIEKNILSNTGFLGRISITLHLKELPLKDCNQLLDALSCHMSSFEKFNILSVTGGIPRYLEEINPTLSAENNIRELCFKPTGLLFREFEQIFSDLFSKRSLTYKNIVRVLSNGPLHYEDIAKKADLITGSQFSGYLEDLIKAGFISRNYTWDIKSRKVSRLSLYRLSDNYVRFYLKYIEKNYDRIERNHFKFQKLSEFTNWQTIMGYQFESLVLNNREFIMKTLHLDYADIVCDNPFFQRKTARMQGCQIDYLIQTRLNSLFVCEIKFSRRSLGLSIIKEMEEKIARLSKPKGFTCFPVLIHVNGVDESIVESNYFIKIIDFTQLLSEMK